MSLSDEQMYEVARQLAIIEMFVKINATADSDLSELKAVVQKIDSSMEATTNQAATQHPGETVKAAFIAEAKEGASNLTSKEAALCLSYWALEEAGLL